MQFSLEAGLSNLIGVLIFVAIAFFIYMKIQKKTFREVMIEIKSLFGEQNGRR